MSGVEETVERIAAEQDWNQRVNLIRQIPERYGIADHAGMYGAIAEKVYGPNFVPQFAYVPWPPNWDAPRFMEAYAKAIQLTDGFTKVDEDSLREAIEDSPETVFIFRTIVGYIRPEFSDATKEVADPAAGYPPVPPTQLDSLEHGKSPRDPRIAATCARLIVGLMDGTLFPDADVDTVRTKQNKADTVDGWESVRKFVAEGVPYEVYLHQRHFGGPFIQLLNATGTIRGNLIEDAVEAVLREAQIPYIRTGSHNQAAIAEQFQLTVRPAPDFVFFDEHNTLRGLMECKLANNGGTARDKAPRFKTLNDEATRLGGVPLFAVLGGIGWKRAGDAMGPVVRDTQGRVFTLASLDEMLTVAPFPQLAGLAEPYVEPEDDDD